MMLKRFWLGLFMAGMLLGLPASLFAQETTPTVIPPGVTIHVVQRGETLTSIAQANSLSLDDLVRLNGITDPSSIYVGQRLLVPAAGATPVPALSILHIVQPGETLDSIAQLYGLTAADLMAQNHLTDASGFYVGQMLDVSASASTPTPAPSDLPPTPSTPEAVIVHTVARGETLFRIAKQYGVTVNAIAQANQISDPQLIYAGQDLVIPGVQAPQIAVDLPAPVQSLDVEPLIFVEGQTGLIHLTTASAVKAPATFISQNLLDASQNGDTDHTLLVGVPVGTAAKVYPLSLTVTDSAGHTTPLSVNIQILSGGYTRESVQLAPGLSDLLNPQIQNGELTTLQTITSSFTATRYFEGQMGLPVAAPLSSPFGNLRSYNGGAFANIHTGTDFAAASGTPIMAPAAGKVVFAGRLDIRGNATIIDHGWGVFTVYCHQSEQDVKVGDMVTAGQVIGLTGSTGRVTGPHLHWELWIDGVPVDAMQWVSQSFS